MYEIDFDEMKRQEKIKNAENRKAYPFENQAHWIKNEMFEVMPHEHFIYLCSNCSHGSDTDSPFCAYCGAK